ncbi:MAG: hypothetical protein ACLTR6_14275 [Clostridium fessum]
MEGLKIEILISIMKWDFLFYFFSNYSLVVDILFILGVPIKAFIIPISFMVSVWLAVYIGRMDARQGIFLFSIVISIIFICAANSTYVYGYSV